MRANFTYIIDRINKAHKTPMKTIPGSDVRSKYNLHEPQTDAGIGDTVETIVRFGSRLGHLSRKEY